MKSGKATAAVSVAGMILVAGCAGGKLAGGSYRPPAAPITIPANSPKVSLSFTVPNPSTEDVVDTSSAQSAIRRVPAQRNRKYIGSGVFGGYLTVKIFQNGVSAFPDQTFTVGSYGAGFVCTSGAYGLYCYNAANVYAPPGNDTFFVETFDSANHLLSATPGLYGSGFYGTPPSPYMVPYSGTIAIPTYAYVSAVQIVAATKCVQYFANSSVGPSFGFLDADGFQVSGPLVNPVTLNLSANTGFAFYQSGVYRGSMYTIYDATSLYLWNIAAQTGGASASFGATGSTGSIPSNLSSLVAVDHLAFTASPSGLVAEGLAYSTTAISCGSVPLGVYNASTNPYITGFSNPVAIGSSDNPQMVIVLDSGATSPVAYAIDLQGLRTSPSFFVPVSYVSLPSHGPLEVAVSPARRKVYVLNSDGSVQTVDYSAFASSPFSAGAVFYATTGSGLSTPSGSGIDVYTGGTYDSVFIGSAGGPTLYEIDNANTQSPSAPIAISVSGHSAWANAYGYFGLSSATTASAVSADNQNGIVMFRLYDPNGPSGYTPSFIEPCIVSPGPCYSSLGTAWGSGGSLRVPQTMAISGGINGQQLFVSTGGCVELTGESAPGATFNFACGLATTRIVSARDGSGSYSSRWLGGLIGSTLYFTVDGVSRLPASGVSGTSATIVSGGFF